jgi:thiosulfate/3-mercaptopyruvate sulfurtransferase
MTPPELPVPLVYVRWLAAHIDDPRLVVLDATYHPVAPPPPPAGYGGPVYLPHARVFDFDKRICDPDATLPHMMPSAELFEREVRALGVSDNSRIVVYDRLGVFSSPRAWWMFQAMGHGAVAVLDGGLPAWHAAKLPLATEPEAPSDPGRFVARPRPGLFCDADRVQQAIDDPHAVVLDARPEARFFGRTPEPRPGLRSGHMPHAVNLPFPTLQEHGHMRSPAELSRLFQSKIAGQPPLVLSCGSGVTACVLALGATLAGYSDMTVYDGSWSEWALPSSRPVVSE